MLIFMLVGILYLALLWFFLVLDRLEKNKLCNNKIESYFYFIATTHSLHVFSVFPANPVTLLWAEYTNISFYFVWKFNDLFIILVSIYITSLFAKINARLMGFQGQVCRSTYCLTLFWNFVILFCSLLIAKLGKKSAVTTTKFVIFKSFLKAKWVTLSALHASLTSTALAYNFSALLRKKFLGTCG